MPVLIVLLLVFVNILPLAMADSAPTQIRGPKNSDSVLLQKQFGPLTASDTLWRIAEQVKPNSSVTTYQVMYALFLKNPQAFNDANFNHLQPGAMLLLPDLREIRSVDPEVARRKADADDKWWAERVARESAARAKAREAAAKPNVVQQQTAAELTVLKEQYQDSMQLIEGIALENQQLRGSLGRVEEELQGLKAQLAEDSLLQQQLNQLLQQQQQILAEQQAQKAAEEAAKLAAEQHSALDDLLKNPLSWVVAASLPAILLLLGGLFWIMRRSRKTEQTVAAAISEPVAKPGYQSPLPPLDTSQDFDDSLFDLDDSLLGDAFEPKETSKQATAKDSLLDDDLPDFSDDILLDELNEPDPLRTDLLDGGDLNDRLDDSLDITLDEPSAGRADNDLSLPTEDELSFDANNILSDTDLAALLAVEDDADEVIELADPEDSELSDLLGDSADTLPEQREATAFDNQDDIDSLLEEIELDLPENYPEQGRETADKQDNASFAETGLSADTLTDDLADDISLLNEADFDFSSANAQENTVLLDTDVDTGVDTDVTTETRFDNSELEEFAERLAAETEAQDLSDLALDEGQELLSEDEQLLHAELDDIEQQAAAEQSLRTADSPLTAAEELTLSDIDLEQITHNDDDNALSLDLNTAEDNSVNRPSEAALSVENPSQILDSYPELDLAPDEQDTPAELDKDTVTEAQDVIVELDNDAEVAAQDTHDAIVELDNDAEVAAQDVQDAIVELDNDAEFAAQDVQDVQDAFVELDNDAAAAAQDAAELSQLAQQIEQLTRDPDLELDSDIATGTDLALDTANDTDLDSALAQDTDFETELAFDTDTDTDAELDALLNADVNALETSELADTELWQDSESTDTITDNDDELVLGLDDSQFDELLNELAAIKQEDTAAMEADADAEAEAWLNSAIADTSDNDDEPVLSDDDFVEIDNLLNAMEQTEEDQERFTQLNVDVGLDEFADIIGEHNKTDVDQEDAGFAGKLDLIRAYFEMDEPESALSLIDEVLNSDAPDYVKDKATALKPE